MEVKFLAKPGLEDEINSLYAKATASKRDFLVYSESVIKQEIRYIRSPKCQGMEHLRNSLRAVRDWEEIFPSLRIGTGSIGLCSDVHDDEQAERVKKAIQFLLDHAFLFAEIDGLDHARDSGYTSFSHARIVGGRPAAATECEELTFADLPAGASELYKKCVENNRPDLWKVFTEFEKTPSPETWDELRSKALPWHGYDTVWQRCERRATQQDGEDYGLVGRYRDGNIPTTLDIRAAIQ